MLRCLVNWERLQPQITTSKYAYSELGHSWTQIVEKDIEEELKQISKAENQIRMTN